MRHALVAMALALALPRTGRADIILAGAFSDHYSSAGAQVAGQVLVGLWLGEPRDKVSLNPVRLSLPARLGAVKACISASTRDGEYWLHGIYDVPRGTPDQGDVPIQSHYQPDLASYGEADLGIRAELKPDCAAAAPGVFIPAVADGASATLVALVNGQRAVRVRAELRAETGATVASGECTRFAAGRSTAFDTICRIPLPAALTGGGYVLAVERRTRAGDTEGDSFRVGLGRSAR